MKKYLASLAVFVASFWGVPAYAELSGVSNIMVQGAPNSNTNPVVVDSQQQADVTGSLSGTGNSATLQLVGHSCGLLTTTGSYTGVTYNMQSVNDTTSGSYGTLKSVSGGSGFTGNINQVFCAPGYTGLRLIVSAYTSGTINYTIHPVPATSTIMVICGNGGNCVSASGVGSGLSPSGLFALDVNALLMASNGSNNDQLTKDSWTGSGLFITDGGNNVSYVQTAGSAGPNVIKNAASRLVRVEITAAGTSGNVTIYDNASACSGNILAVIPGTTADPSAYVGRTTTYSFKAVNGITSCGATGSPAIAISTYQ